MHPVPSGPPAATNYGTRRVGGRGWLRTCPCLTHAILPLTLQHTYLNTFPCREEAARWSPGSRWLEETLLIGSSLASRGHSPLVSSAMATARGSAVPPWTCLPPNQRQQGRLGKADYIPTTSQESRWGPIRHPLLAENLKRIQSSHWPNVVNHPISALPAFPSSESEGRRGCCHIYAGV